MIDHKFIGLNYPIVKQQYNLIEQSNFLYR